MVTARTLSILERYCRARLPSEVCRVWKGSRAAFCDDVASYRCTSDKLADFCNAPVVQRSGQIRTLTPQPAVLPSEFFGSDYAPEPCRQWVIRVK